MSGLFGVCVCMSKSWHIKIHNWCLLGNGCSLGSGSVVGQPREIDKQLMCWDLQSSML